MGVKEKLDEFILASEKRHNFLVSEIQQSEQRTIDEFNAAIKAEIEPVKERLTSLESTRTYCQGVIKAVGVGVPAVGSLAWLVFKLGNLVGGGGKP